MILPKNTHTMHKPHAIAYDLYMPMCNHTSKVIDTLFTGFILGSVFAAAVVAPNSIQALEKPVMKLVTGRDKRREAKRIARYMKQQKLVVVTANPDGSYTVSLTDKGMIRARRAYFEQLTIPSSKWDEKWRIVMFDIPEKHKAKRDYLSHHLKRIGFKQLQRSVFVFPHPVDDFIAVVRELFPEISQHLIYLTADQLDSHNQLVKRFQNYI